MLSLYPISLVLIALWLIVLTAGFFVLTGKTLKAAAAPAFPQIGLTNADEGLSKNMAFPPLDLVSFNGESLPLQNSIIIFSLKGCKACLDLYPSLLSYKESHPNLPIAMLLFAETEHAAERTMHEHGLTLPVFFMSVDHIPMLQTSLFPFGYALNETGKIVAKGSVNGQRELDLLEAELPLTTKDGITKAG